MRSNSTFLFLLFTIVTLLSCNFKSSDRLQNRTLENIPQNFEVKQKVVFEKDLPGLFIQVPAFQYVLSLKIYIENSKKTELFWTTEKNVKDSLSDQLHKIQLDCPQSVFTLEINIFGTNRQLLYSDLIHVDKKNGSNNIYLEDEQKNVLMDHQVKIGTKNKLCYAGESDLNVLFFPDKLLPAPPPYSQNEGYFNPFEPSSTESKSVKNFDFFLFDRIGTYYIYTNENQDYGIFISVFDKDFPAVSQIKDLILATRFITKNEEYKKLLNSDNPKTSLDEFWLARNKNESEAKQLIKSYYNRVKEANRLFSFAKEGWKTDLGMIFIIFGRPAIVRKYSDKLIWYYTHDQGRNPVEFVFTYKFGQTVLERFENFREPWNAEILKWRMGKPE
jgi:GWxTD domain-containing protein